MLDLVSDFGDLVVKQILKFRKTCPRVSYPCARPMGLWRALWHAVCVPKIFDSIGWLVTVLSSGNLWQRDNIVRGSSEDSLREWFQNPIDRIYIKHKLHGIKLVTNPISTRQETRGTQLRNFTLIPPQWFGGWENVIQTSLLVLPLCTIVKEFQKNKLANLRLRGDPWMPTELT